jgi:hypothetical protein
MKSLLFIILSLIISQQSFSYSFLPPNIIDNDFNHNECYKKYYTLNEMEKKIYLSNKITDDGKHLIFNSILKKNKGNLIDLDMNFFSREICNIGDEQGIRLFKNRDIDNCPFEVIKFTLEDDIITNKEATIDLSGKLNTEGVGEIVLRVSIKL